MVDFQDPALIIQDLLSTLKLWHALAGLYIWEYLITFDYEWSVIRGRRPYRWTIWIYSITRLATLLTAIVAMISMDDRAKFDCQGIILTLFTISYVGFTGASLLIVLRNIAIWNGQKIVIAITTGIWLANIGFFIQSLARVRTSWDPLLSTCAVLDIHSTKLNTITTLVTDIALLLIMLIGLLRLGFHEPGVYGLGRLMWRQGIVWLFLATIAEIPPVVFISLNLNDALDYMFSFPAMVIMTIAATRIYRSLTDFSTTSGSAGDNFLSSGSTAVFKANKGSRVPADAVALEPMEVVVHRTLDQSQSTVAQTSSQ